MFIKFLSCAIIFIIFINGVVLSLPIPNLYGSFSDPKMKIPFNENFDVQTSLENSNIIEFVTSRMHSSGFDIIPKADTDNSNIRNENILTVKPKMRDDVTATTNTFKNKTIVTNTDTSILPFNDDNSITDVNTEAEFSSKSDTEFTTDFTTTEDYESTTTEIDEEIVLRSEVSPDVLASLLGG